MPDKNESTRPALFLVKPAATAIEEEKKHVLEGEIADFANNLEVARALFQRHPRLVTGEAFPEPYRSAIIATQGYDPQDDCGLSLGDLHITNPAAAEREREARARGYLAADAARDRKTLETLTNRAHLSGLVQ